VCVSTVTAAAPDAAPLARPPAEVPDFAELLQAAITNAAAAIGTATRHKRTSARAGIRVTTVISFGPATVAGISKRLQWKHVRAAVPVQRPGSTTVAPAAPAPMRCP
jgi:hypothetical protein